MFFNRLCANVCELRMRNMYLMTIMTLWACGVRRLGSWDFVAIAVYSL